MKICFVLPEISGGGIATYYKNLIAGLQKEGHETVVVLADYKQSISNTQFPGKLVGITAEDYNDGLSQYKGADLFPSLKHRLALSYACYRKAVALKADVVEITDYNLLFYQFIIDRIAPTIIRLAGSSGQLEMHEHRTADQLESAFLINLEKTLINQADYIIGLSKLNVDYWNSQLSKKAALHLPYLHNTPQPLTTEAKNNKGVVLGRLQLWKGAVFLCEYYRKYPSSPDVDWIGGDNFYLDYKKSMLAYLTEKYPDVMGKKIHFKGRLAYDEAQQKIAEAAFVLVPSTWDTFNLVVTEAMAKGKVVISSTGAGATELIEDKINGFTFGNGDVDSLHEAFESYGASNTLTDIAQKAADSIKTTLNNPQLVEDRIAVYQSVLNAYQPATDQSVAFIHKALSGQSFLENLHNKLGLRKLATIIRKKLWK